MGINGLVEIEIGFLVELEVNLSVFINLLTEKVMDNSIIIYIFNMICGWCEVALLRSLVGQLQVN